MSKSLAVFCLVLGLLLGSQVIVFPEIKSNSGLLSQTTRSEAIFSPGNFGQTSLCAVQTTTQLAGVGIFAQRSWALSSDGCTKNLAGISGDSLQRYGVFKSLNILPTDRPVWTPINFAVGFEFWLYVIVLWLMPKPTFNRALKRDVARIFNTSDKDRVRFITSFLMLLRTQKSLSLSQWNYVYSVCLTNNLKGQDILKMEQLVKELSSKTTIKDVLKEARHCPPELRAEFYEVATHLLSANGYVSTSQFAHLSVLSKLVPQHADRKLVDTLVSPSKISIFNSVNARA